MTDNNVQPQPPDQDEAVRRRILTRAAVINAKLLTRLSTVAKDIEEGSIPDAVSCLGGLERRIYAIRSLLLLTN
jgi:hypothetical protein